MVTPKSNDLDRFHSRRHPRIPHYDYFQPNYYFVTVCAKDMRCLFGRAGEPNWRGSIAEKGLLQIREHFPNVCIDKYVIMPNHIHDHVIRDQQAYEKIWLYIDANPLNWEKDCFFAEKAAP